jgi:hypothetical protein
MNVMLHVRFLNGVNWLWLLSIFAGLKTLGNLQYRGGTADFFLTIEFNYIIIRITLCRRAEQNQ